MAGKIRIINMHGYKHDPLNEILINVDRTTIIGNPFFMTDESHRDEVCDKYEDYFRMKMNHDRKFKDEVDAIVEHVKRGDNIALGCWCAPKRCHAETIVRYVEAEVSRVPVAYPPTSTWEPKKKEEVKTPSVIYYAGIGSRETPNNILARFNSIGNRLAVLGFVLRSGGADGADTAFQLGCADPSKMEIYLPWPGFNNNVSKFSNVTPAAMAMAAKFHPAWTRLSDGAKKLQARNCYQILGYNLSTPSTFVVCYTKGGKGEGGTGQAIRLANHHNIPVFDFGAEGTEDKLNEYIDSLIPTPVRIPKVVEKAPETGFRGERNYLSNMYPCKVTFDGITYDNSEAAFQAQKCLTTEGKMQFVGLDGYKAKALGRQVKLRPDWNTYRLTVMKMVVSAKFHDNPEFAAKLKAEVGDLVENNNWGDKFWGVVNGVGKNNLGKMLMELREKFIMEAIDDNHDEEDDRVSDEPVYSTAEKEVIDSLMSNLNQSDTCILTTFSIGEWGMQSFGIARVPYIERCINKEGDEYFYYIYKMERWPGNQIKRYYKKIKITLDIAKELALRYGLRQ